MDFARKLAVAVGLAMTLAACGAKRGTEGEVLPSPSSTQSVIPPAMPPEVPALDPLARFPLRKAQKQLEGPAQNKAIIFGGNCEGRKDRANIFWNSFKGVSTKLTTFGWKPDLLYSVRSAENGQTYEDLTRIAGNPTVNVGEGSLENLFASLDAAMTLPRGSQLLLVVLTHGWPATQARAHSWCVTYTQVETGEVKTADMAVDYPPFYKRLEMLREAGVRVGIVDESCYSGGSLDVLSTQACVVTTQTRNRYAREGTVLGAFDRVFDHANLRGTSNFSDLYLALLSEARTDSVDQPGLTGFVKKNDVSERLARWLVRYDFESATDGSAWNQRYDRAFPVEGDDLEAIRAYLLRERPELNGEEQARLENYFGRDVPELRTRSSLQAALDDLKQREIADRTRFADGAPEQLLVELKALMLDLEQTALEVHYRLSPAMTDKYFRGLRLEHLLAPLQKWVVRAPGQRTESRIQNGEVVFGQSALNAYADLVFGEAGELEKTDTKNYVARAGLITQSEAASAYHQVADHLAPSAGLDARGIVQARVELVGALKLARDAAVFKMDPAVKSKINRYLELSQKLRGYVRSTDAFRYNRMQKVSLRMRAADFLVWERKLLEAPAPRSEEARQFQPCLDFKFESPVNQVPKPGDDPIGG